MTTFGIPETNTETVGKDIYKILKFGSKGNEVRALQTELKVSIDGSFGNETLTALQKARGVRKISLHGFFSTKQAIPVKPIESTTAESAFKKGQKLMVNTRSGFTAQDVQIKADGTYFTNGTNKITGLDFGDKKIKDIQTTSYENIKTLNFELQDTDNVGDLTGASKVELKKIVGEGGLVSEVDRSSGRPVPTGRKIRTVVRADIRYYTIMFNGEKFTLSSEELGNIRI